MRHLPFALLLALFGCNAPSPELAPATVPAAPTSAIPTLSFVFLETGEHAAELSPDQIREASIGHRTNIERLGDQGILLLAGPFGVPHDPRWRGIFVFDVATLDQALELTATDPAVQMGAFSMRVLPWRTHAPMRRLRDLENRRKERGEDFRGRAYVLGMAHPADKAARALEWLTVEGKVPFQGELGGEAEGQLLFSLTAETIDEARAWLDSTGATDVEWELSSWYATEYLMAGLPSPAR